MEVRRWPPNTVGSFLECFYSNVKALAENVFHLYHEENKRALLLYVALGTKESF
jgi:hypothetical protein